ncbi:MAG: GHKL domain-containing protein [Rhizobiaceae bacterium]|nr:MAG: GHKL domain-containing protein [Rhizobiaceae bacterium]
MSQDHLGLFDTPPSRKQVRFALAIVGVLLATFLVILPVRNVGLREIHAFIPMVDAIMFLGELITASLLYAQAIVFRSRALTVLAGGYVFAALLLIPHALAFPGAFAPSGLLGAGVSTTGIISTFRPAAFPIAVLLYVQLKRADLAAQPRTEHPSPGNIVSVLAATSLAAAVTLLATSGHDLLPPLFANLSDVTRSNAVFYGSVVFALFVIGAVVLYRNRRSVLDMWLLVAFASWLIQSLLIMTFESRYSVGWYCLYLMTLFSHLVVMLALIAESNRLYVRLALATSARDREREAWLSSMDEVAAAIYHEVGQPLSTVSTNAMASVNWLTRARPDPEMAIKSLRAISDAAQRTFDVLKNIRAMFNKGPGISTEFGLNDLVRETASLLDRELAAKKITLRLELDDALPLILADRVQIQRVLVNLVTNAIDSLSATRGRSRRIIIRSMRLDGQDVMLEVSDTGTGIATEEMPLIFEPFFTTKSTGTGLGLSLCRNIAEEHGGRLRASHGKVHGVTFRLQLPHIGSPYTQPPEDAQDSIDRAPTI